MDYHDKVKIIIVGCGEITKYLHLPSVLWSANADLAALVDCNPRQAQNISRKFSVNCPISENLEGVINEADGVIIATPNYTHYSLAKIALTHQVPVLIEKPITTTYRDALELCELAEKKNTFITVGYNTRHYPIIEKVKELLEKKFFGKIISFHYEFGSKGNWEPVSGYNIDLNKAGGGVLVVTGSHFLDRMLYWFGEPQNFEYQDDSYGGVEANCKATMIFGDGNDSFRGSFFFSKTLQLRNKLVLDTEKYYCELDEFQTKSIRLYPKDHPDLKFEVFSNDYLKNQNYLNDNQRQFEEFAANIKNKKKVTVDGRFAALSIKLIEEMYKKRSQLNEPWLDYSRVEAN